MAAGSEPTELTVTAWSGLALERAQRSGRRRWLSPRRRKRMQLQRGIVALVDPLMSARHNVARGPTVMTGVLLGRPPTGLGTELAPRRAVLMSWPTGSSPTRRRASSRGTPPGTPNLLVYKSTL